MKLNETVEVLSKKSQKEKTATEMNSGVISQILRNFYWQNEGNQIPLYTLLNRLPIKVTDLPSEVRNGNKSNKSFIIQVRLQTP